MKSTEEIISFVKATLNLFKAVPDVGYENFPDCTLDNEKNLAYGFFITERAFQVCQCIARKDFFNFLKDKFGYDMFALNQGFYKSFATVANSTPQKLLANKLLHYMSTYDFEALGIFNRDTVYIPNDALNLPENSKPITITVIDVIDNAEIKARVIKLIQSGAALSEETLDNLVTVIKFLEIKLNLDGMPNKELAIRLCVLLEIVPSQPVQFLRCLVYVATYSTLLIKNQETIGAIKTSTQKFDYRFKNYIAKNGLEKLASIFHRFKPLWLAFKCHSNYMKSTINKMRKLADRYHKPVKPQLLEHLTSAENIHIEKLKSELSRVPVFKRVSLANALLYRIAEPTDIVYTIRNGKAFVEEYINKLKFEPQKILDVIIDSIVKDVRPNVEGKKVYIPANFNYAVPVSEKKIIGNIPYGSSYSFTGKSCVVGVHWFNLLEGDKEIRVDLDLHFNSRNINVGWHNDFYGENYQNSRECKIIFSGDMTDAPIASGGATEAFFAGEALTNAMIIANLNIYSRGYSNSPVPFKLFLADVEQVNLDRQYLVGAHEMAFCVPNEIDAGQMFLGFLLANETGDKKFYFYPAEFGNNRVSRYNKQMEQILSAMVTTFNSFLSLNEVLTRAGAILAGVTAADCDINLDPVETSRYTFLDLFMKNN